MTDDKKPDRFEEKAREIVEACFACETDDVLTCQVKIVQALREEAAEPLYEERLEFIRKTAYPFHDGEPVFSLTKTVKAMAEEIWECRSNKSQLVSEEELEVLAKQLADNVVSVGSSHTYISVKNGFYWGFLKAQSMRATVETRESYKQYMAMVWPSEADIEKEWGPYPTGAHSVWIHEHKAESGAWKMYFDLKEKLGV